MESTDLLMVALTSLLTAIPSVIVYVVILVIAVSKWNAHPRVSMFAATGAGLLLLLDLLGRVFFTIMPIKMMREDGVSHTQLSTMMTIAGLAAGVLHAVALGILAASIFVERGQPSREAVR